jgi:hypothetical protein
MNTAPPPVDLIHVGFHKTASTFLQRRYFGLLDGVELLNTTYDGIDLDKWFYDNFVNMSPLGFDSDAFAEAFASRLVEVGAAARGGLRLLSDENLSGDIYHGLDAYELMRRLHAVFGEVDILIVVRNQVDFLLSTYSNYVLHGGIENFKRWLRGTNTRWGMILQKVRYSALVKQYMELFGEERVNVVLYEELWSDETGLPQVMRKYGIQAPSGDMRRKRQQPGRSLVGNYLMARLNCLGFSRLPFRGR